MIVIIIASTPSLNASSRFFPICGIVAHGPLGCHAERAELMLARESSTESRFLFCLDSPVDLEPDACSSSALCSFLRLRDRAARPYPVARGKDRVRLRYRDRHRSLRLP